LLPIALDAAIVDDLFRAMYSNEGYRLIVDLERQVVEPPDGQSIAFEVDSFRRDCLLKGLDDIGITLERAEAIKAFERDHKVRFPWVFETLEV